MWTSWWRTLRSRPRLGKEVSKSKVHSFWGGHSFLQHAPKISSASKKEGFPQISREIAQIVGKQDVGSMRVKRLDLTKKPNLTFPWKITSALGMSSAHLHLTDLARISLSQVDWDPPHASSRTPTVEEKWGGDSPRSRLRYPTMSKLHQLRGLTNTNAKCRIFWASKGPERKPWPRGKPLNRKNESQCVFFKSHLFWGHSSRDPPP